MRILDLTVALNEQTPVYAGDPATIIKPAGIFEKDGFNGHYVSVGTHVGTHIDAPLHMLEGGKALDQVPVEQFVGRGVYVKVEDKKFDLEKIKNSGIREGDIVLFHTGLIDQYHEKAYFDDYPEISEEIARYLVGKKIKMIGMDMCGPDHPPHKTHKILFSGDVLIIENLTNLAALAGKEFMIYALPVKLQVDGAPARVIASIQD